MPWLNTPGRVSVWVFFGLSGYVIGHGFFSGRYAAHGTKLKTYLLRRATRVLPLFWLVTLIAIGLGLVIDSQLTINSHTIAAAMFALQWSHTAYFVGVFWTLGLEIQFYLLAPLLFWIIARSGSKWPLILGVLWIVLWALLKGDDRTLIGNLQHFIVGMAVAKLMTASVLDRIISSRFAALGFIALGMALIAVASDLYHNGSFWSGPGALWTDLAILALLLGHCSIERRRVASNWLTRPLMYLGVLAYGLYAWHGLVLTYITSMGQSLPFVLAISLAISWLSYVLIEGPVIRLARTHPGNGKV